MVPSLNHRLTRKLFDLDTFDSDMWNHVLREVQILACEGTILRAKRAGQDMPGHVWRSIYSKRLSRGQNRYSVDADWGVLDGVHIGATWRIRLNRPCAAAMRPYVKLL